MSPLPKGVIRLPLTNFAHQTRSGTRADDIYNPPMSGEREVGDRRHNDIGEFR